MFHAKTQSTAKPQTIHLKSLRALRYFASLREPIIRRSIVSVIFLSLLIPSSLNAQSPANNANTKKLALTPPESVGMSSDRLAKIDEAALASIGRKETPGAVLLL